MKDVGLVIPYDEVIAVSDSGCDQCILNLKVFLLQNSSFTGRYFDIGGALNGMQSDTCLEVVNDAYTKMIFDGGIEVIGIFHQGLLDLDENQNEALIQPHQLQSSGVIYDDVVSIHLGNNGKPGTQSITVAGHTLPLFFDGYKTYFRLVKPTEEDLQYLPHIVMTSKEIYEPQQRKFVERMSRLYNSDKAKTAPVISSRRRPVSEPTVEEWRANLGFPSVEVTKHTLRNTTQLLKTMEMETREYMRDYKQSRTTVLKPYRIKDVLYTDTFFSTIKSVRGHTCFQMFALKRSMYTKSVPMKAERFVYDAYRDFIVNVGAPVATVSDNAQVYTSAQWKEINRTYLIQTRFTITYHQSSNFAELIGVLVLWFGILEFLDLVSTHLSRQGLKNKTSHQALFRDTEDISIFRFPWFCPVWFYAPTLDFPVDRMKPGFFLGIATNVGDGFSYIIVEGETIDDLPKRNVRTIVRNIVRKRSLKSNVAPTVRREEGSFTFVDENGVEIPDDSLSEEDLFNTYTTSEVDMIEVEDPESDFNQLQHDNLNPLLPLADPDNDGELDEDTFDDTPPLVLNASSDSEYSSDEEDDDDEEDDNDNNANPTVTPAVAPASPVVPSEEAQPSGPTVIPITNWNNETGPSYITQDENDVPEDEVEEDPIELESSDKMYDDIAEQLNIANDPNMPETEEIISIDNPRWNGKTLEFDCTYDTGEIEIHPFERVQSDQPTVLAKFLSRKDVNIGNDEAAQNINRWSRMFNRALCRAWRRSIKSNVFRFYSGRHHTTNKKLRSRRLRKAMRAKFEDEESDEAQAWLQDSIKGRRTKKFEYSIEVPRNWEDVIRIDTENNNRDWQEAVEKEIGALLNFHCFDIKPKGYKPPQDYQYVCMHLVYCAKVDLRKKARLVCDGSRVDPRGLNTRATVVRGISVRLLDVIAHHWKKRILSGDIGNAFVQSKTKEKVYTKLGPEFGEHSGMIALIVKALYGLTTSAAAFRKAFADFIRSMGFKPSRYDRDVWMCPCPNGNGYDYICTHVDDFKVIADRPEDYIDRIATAFFIKEQGPPEYYLGNDYKFYEDFNAWTFSAETYEKEAIRKVEEMFNKELKKVTTPLPVGCPRLEEDKSPFLKLKEHRQFQCLLGMLQWLHTIGRPELGPLMANLNRFGTCPREKHLEIAIRSFGYLKQTKGKKIKIDSSPLEFVRESPDYEQLRPDFLEDYAYAREEVDPNMPTPFGAPLQMTILVDADHAHDRLTGRSLTGIIIFVGSTPVYWSTKRQGAVATSTYHSEFAALKEATEQAINIRYYLRCLGVHIPNDGSHPTQVFGDNFSVIQSAANPQHDLTKKHVALSFHFVREAIAAGIIEPYWLKGECNLADIMTKQISTTEFNKHIESIYWRHDFSLKVNNKFGQEHNIPKNSQL
ncbi:hypothetical protein CTEN210_05523 [Chaetoceros tenuissimus]|uniref:Reverse transcriptase Ty1/copia-type domain-containing protein n=1 Tax=Chaetoceros tenuissimus TaxID=426638 RepID=A0AAD3CN44_9STRA|nr:hypothetical protein CTEN210_05523 [Chaetoceros tenuissimus]